MQWKLTSAFLLVFSTENYEFYFVAAQLIIKSAVDNLYIHITKFSCGAKQTAGTDRDTVSGEKII